MDEQALDLWLDLTVGTDNGNNVLDPDDYEDDPYPEYPINGFQ